MILIFHILLNLIGFSFILGREISTWLEWGIRLELEISAWLGLEISTWLWWEISTWLGRKYSLIKRNESRLLATLLNLLIGACLWFKTNWISHRWLIAWILTIWNRENLSPRHISDLITTIWIRIILRVVRSIALPRLSKIIWLKLITYTLRNLWSKHLVIVIR